MTSISFSLGVPGHVRLAIFDVMGREVAELLETDVIGGPHQITWNGKDHFGRLVGRGNYFLKLESGREIRTQKITKWN